MSRLLSRRLAATTGATAPAAGRINRQAVIGGTHCSPASKVFTRRADGATHDLSVNNSCRPALCAMGPQSLLNCLVRNESVWLLGQVVSFHNVASASQPIEIRGESRQDGIAIYSSEINFFSFSKASLLMQ